VSSAGGGHDGSDLVVLSGIDVTPELRASGLFSQLVRTAATPALVATDLEGRVTLYNSAAERLLGFPAASMIGRVLDVGLFSSPPSSPSARSVWGCRPTSGSSPQT
jgi:PAS domain S-box-containing protein